MLSVVKLDPDTVANSQNQILIAVKSYPDSVAKIKTRLELPESQIQIKIWSLLNN
jgi:hypothetical protein